MYFTLKFKLITLLSICSQAIFSQLHYLPSTPENLKLIKDRNTESRLKTPDAFIISVLNEDTILKSNNWLNSTVGFYNQSFPLFKADSIFFDKRIIGSWSTENKHLIFVIEKPSNSDYLTLDSYTYQENIKRFHHSQQNVQLAASKIGSEMYLEHNIYSSRQFIQQFNKYALVQYSFTNNDDVAEFRQISNRYYYENPDIEITKESPIVLFSDVNSYRDYIKKFQVKTDFFLHPFRLHRINMEKNDIPLVPQ